MKRRTLNLVVLVLIYAAFISLGLPDGILGAVWPQMRVDFSVHLNDNWPMLALATAGGSLSSILSGPSLRWLGVGRVLLLTTFLNALVLVAYAVSPTFAFIATLAFFLGLGNGAIDAGLNSFVANNLSSRHMNWLHAFWGVGMSLGTLIVSGVIALEGTWRTAYLVVGLLQASLGVAFLCKQGSLPTSSDEGPQERSDHPALRFTCALPATWASLAVFFAYCGVESGTGLWMSSLLCDGRGWTMEAASLMVTLYWGSLTFGRFLVGTISPRTTPLRIVSAALAGVVAGTSLLALSSAFVARPAVAGLLTAFGLLLTGLSVSPVYPMLMHDTPRCVGADHAPNLIGLQTATGILGYTALPILIGTLMRVGTTEWLGPMVLTLATATVALLAMRERYVARNQGRSRNTAGARSVTPTSENW